MYAQFMQMMKIEPPTYKMQIRGTRVSQIFEMTLMLPKIITEAANENAYIIWGHVYDPDMENNLQITVIATGFDEVPNYAQQYSGSYKTESKPLVQPKQFSENSSEEHTISRTGYAKPLNRRPVYPNGAWDNVNFGGSVRPTEGTVSEQPDLNGSNEHTTAENSVLSVKEEQPVPKFNRQQNTFGNVTSDLFASSSIKQDNFDMPSILRRKQQQQDENQ